jgi:hypothetical protein
MSDGHHNSSVASAGSCNVMPANFPASAALPARVDGIEVAKLLKTLGETNFDCDHTTLFSHCFQAYMVLSEIYGNLAEGTNGKS